MHHSPDIKTHNTSRTVVRGKGIWLILLCTSTMGLLSGCGAGSDMPTTYEFSGTLTHNGIQVENVILMFQPTEGRASVAQVGGGGKFKMLYTKDVPGVAAGTHTVYVEQAFDDPESSGPNPELVGLFNKYGSGKSSFTIEVTQDEADYQLALD